MKTSLIGWETCAFQNSTLTSSPMNVLVSCWHLMKPAEFMASVRVPHCISWWWGLGQQAQCLWMMDLRLKITVLAHPSDHPGRQIHGKSKLLCYAHFWMETLCMPLMSTSGLWVRCFAHSRFHSVAVAECIMLGFHSSVLGAWNCKEEPFSQYEWETWSCGVLSASAAAD